MTSHDTLKSYESFLRSHPNSKYTSEAEAKIWEKTQTSNFCIDWQEIMKNRYDYGIKAPSEWSCNKIEVVQEIAQTKIACIDKHEIIDRYKRTALNKAFGEGTKSKNRAFPERECEKIEVFMQFLQTYPELKYAAEAKIRIEELDWEYVRYIGTIPLLRKFLKIYPDTNHADEIPSRIEKRSWVLASSLYRPPRKRESVLLFDGDLNLISSDEDDVGDNEKSLSERMVDLQKFLENYPNSQYSTLAKEQIRLIQEEYIKE